MEVDQIVKDEFEEEKIIVQSENIESVNNNKVLQLPCNYKEIYKCYKSKDYEKCIAFIEEVEETYMEYEILKSACLIHSGQKISEAHKILDDALDKDSDNPFTLYAKGLAFYHEENWQESIFCFKKARRLNPSSDLERAEIMLQKAEAKIEEMKRSEKHTSSVRHFRRSGGSTHIVRRFGCELCEHFFGKKYNLDRHNRSIHNRDTPDNFPKNPKHIAAALKPAPVIKRNVVNSPAKSISSPVKSSSASSASSSSSPPPKRLNQTLPSIRKGKVKCGVCKKLFKKSSIARHAIIHTGNKPHRCDECPMAFFQKSDLTRHQVSSSE